MGIKKMNFSWQEYLELLFKISYVLLAFATYVTLLYASPVQPLLVKLTIVLGAVLILTRLLKWKDYVKTPGLLLMALMCASFLLSTFMNRQYGMTDNLKWLIWMGIQFFGLYAMPLKRDKSHVIFEYKIIGSLVLVGSVLGSIASLKMLPEGYSQMIQTSDGEFIITGFMWDRLWGVYTDPNYGAVISAIGIFLALGWIFISKGIAVKSLCGLAIATNYAYVVFSDSRTATLALALALLFFLGIFVFKKIKENSQVGRGKKQAVKLLVAVLAALLLMGGCYRVSYVWKEDNIQYQQQIAKERASKLAKKDAQKNKNNQKNQKKTETLRDQQLDEDVSNGRFNLWKSAIEVWESSPVYGTGYSTFAKYAEEHVPDTYAVNNSQGTYISLHNEFFNVLAYQGALGALLFVAMILRLLIYILKGNFVAMVKGDLYPVIILCCLGTVAVSMVFLLDGFYANSVSAAVLWIFSGYLVNLAGHSQEEKSQEGA